MQEGFPPWSKARSTLTGLCISPLDFDQDTWYYVAVHWFPPMDSKARVPGPELWLVIELGEHLGLDNQDVIELSLRKLAREWGIVWAPATRCKDGSEQAAGPSDTL